jgi:MinD-like ATPase involved in chromosome partitioning or flagellar assembly
MVTCLADPVSVNRFIYSLENFSQLVDFEKVHLVVNRTRESVLGKKPENQLSETLRSHTPFRTIDFIPEDPAFDPAMLKSIPLSYAAKKSAALLAISGLARKTVHGE